jgi:hypothetical protein
MLKTAVRQWLFDLHENVNRSRDIDSEITIEQIPEIYKAVDLAKEWGEFYTKVKQSTEVGLVSQTALQAFHRRFGMLRKLVGRY